MRTRTWAHVRYLYAQFSLSRTEGPRVSAEQLTRIQTWDAILTDIVKQEMLHLALATNILTSLGAAPHFERPNFPIVSRWYPPGVMVVLLPFGEKALRHFMYLERPEGMTLNEARDSRRLRTLNPARSMINRLSPCPRPGRQ